jgi:UDP-3-O-[3-hydroxymyristoyl] glucosamine N-acyltransferase
MAFMNIEISIQDILDCINNALVKVLGSETRYVRNVAPIGHAKSHDVAFCSAIGKDSIQIIQNSSAGIILCSDKLGFEEADYSSKTLILVENPRLEFIRIVNTFFTKKIDWGIHPTSIIHPDAKIAERVFIGPFCYIGNSVIDEGSVIYGNAYIYDNTTIGKNVLIHAGAVIGADGFGYARNNAGIWEKFQHLGGVIIKDNVEIGANACIDRGTLGNTIINEGIKIDNLVHIAHNIIIGKNSMIIAHATICGSVIIGEGCWIGPCACIKDGVKLGNNVNVGMGAIVTRDIADGLTVLGSPAKPVPFGLR